VKRNVHLSKLDDLPLLCSLVYTHDTHWGTDPERSLDDITSENNGVSVGKCLDDGKSDGPDCIAHGIAFTSFNDFGEVLLESVKQVVDDGSYEFSARSLQ
jgi:hypothetical protein